MSAAAIISAPQPVPQPAMVPEPLVADQQQPEKEILQQYILQPKLSVGAPDDPYEKEADSVADKIMRMPEQHFLQKKCANCEKEEQLQPKRLTNSIPHDEISRKISVQNPDGMIPHPGNKGITKSNGETVFGYVNELCPDTDWMMQEGRIELLDTSFCFPSETQEDGTFKSPSQLSGHPVSCECLCEMSMDPLDHITIRISDTEEGTGTSDDSIPGHPVITVPSPNAKKSNVMGASGTMVESPPYIILAHELCGHHWLNKRSDDDENMLNDKRGGHDPTINRENEIRSEHNLEARGTFRDPCCGLGDNSIEGMKGTSHACGKKFEEGLTKHRKYAYECKHWREEYNKLNGTSFTVEQAIPIIPAEKTPAQWRLEVYFKLDAPQPWLTLEQSLTEEGKTNLDTIESLLAKHPDWNTQLAGNASSDKPANDEGYNKRLAHRRVIYIQDELHSKGVTKTRMITFDSDCEKIEEGIHNCGDEIAEPKSNELDRNVEVKIFSPQQMEANETKVDDVNLPQQNFIQRKCAHCEEEEKKQVQRKPLSKLITPFIQTKSEAASPVSNSLSNKISSSKGSGSAIDSSTQTFMSNRFGNDFGAVKIHTDSDAIQMNRELNARAFTVGNDIYFNEGQYQPHADSGKHLLAHELTHTVQQTGTLQRQIFGNDVLFDQLDSCPPQAELQTLVVSDEGIAEELYGNVAVPVDYENSSGTLINIDLALLRDEWQPYFKDCVAPKDIEPEVDIPVEQMVCNADTDFVGELEISAAKVTASKGIRLHTTPDVNDCDYKERIGISAKVYPNDSDITIIATSNKSNVGWVKIQTLDDFEGWIEERFIKRVKKDSTKDALTKFTYTIQSGDTLEKVINEAYKDYPYTTGNDRRTIAHALFILNDGDTDAFYFRGDGSSFWKDTLDSDFSETRNIYATIRLKEGKSLRLPSKAYIDLLRDEGKVGVRPDWKNTAIEIGRSIEGFLEGVVYGFGKAIVDTLVGLWDLIKGIVTGELFEQAYEFYKQIRDKGVKVIWNLIEGFFMGVYKDFVDAWNNPNPYKKWFFFGEIIGMILFEIAIAFLTAGAGLAKHLGKLSKVLDAIPGLKKIATKVGSKVDDIPSKETAALVKVKTAESKIETLGDMTGETRKMLRDPKNEKLLDSLNDNPRASRALKKCNSPCFPEFALPEQIKQIDDILAKIDTHLDSADYEGLKSFFHEAKTPDELGEKIDIIQSGLEKFVDNKARGISPYEIDRLKKTQTLRNTTGHIKGGDGLPNVNASNVAAWYDERIMQIPKQVADKLKTQFKKGVPNFKTMREAFWTEMYKDPVINDFFTKRGAAKSLEEMRNGRPPFAMSGQRTGGGANAKLQLNHQQALEHAGETFDLDNLEIVSPVFHEAMKQ